MAQGLREEADRYETAGDCGLAGSLSDRLHSEVAQMVPQQIAQPPLRYASKVPVLAASRTHFRPAERFGTDDDRIEPASLFCIVLRDCKSSGAHDEVVQDPSANNTLFVTDHAFVGQRLGSRIAQCADPRIGELIDSLLDAARPPLRSTRLLGVVMQGVSNCTEFVRASERAPVGPYVRRAETRSSHCQQAIPSMSGRWR